MRCQLYIGTNKVKVIGVLFFYLLSFLPSFAQTDVNASSDSVLAVELMKQVIAAKKSSHPDNHDFGQYFKYQKQTLALNDIRPELLASVEDNMKQSMLNQIELCPYNNKLILPISADDLGQTGKILKTIMKDVLTDVNIFDDQISFLKHSFASPIGSEAISSYRYAIEDTLYVDNDRCYHLHFQPINQQDFGLQGDLYILADSTRQVKRCQMTIPKRNDVSFVENMKVTQEFSRLLDGEWVLGIDDVFAEIKLANILQPFAVIRSTRLSDHAFDEQPRQSFKKNGIDVIIRTIENGIDFKYFIFGPINTMFTSNFIDGFRTRLSAHTTANLHPNLFFRGYVARGWGSHKWYYKGDVIWSFNKKEHLPSEFPVRILTFSSSYDIESPSDKFLRTDKDNVFTAFKWSKVDKMNFYNRQSLTFEWEENKNLRTTVRLKTEEDETAGNQIPLKYRTTDLFAELRFSQAFTISHTLGIKGFLGGDYSYNLTQASAYKRFELRSWGNMDFLMKGSIQWEKVPYPLLIMPETNLSYILHGNTFEAINNMEFPTDRSLSAIVNWDLNGKLFNCIPLLKKLKWKEWIAVRCLWGKLTDKNNPLLEKNQGGTMLMCFPDGSYVIDPDKPYWELSLGIHNIFKVFHVEYVRRLNYNELPTAHKHGVRFMMRMKL